MEHAADLELLSGATNQVVVRTTGRRYPGIVIQGDRLGEWVRLAQSSDPAHHEWLRDQLEDYLRELIQASMAAGVGVPAGLPNV